ncbi:hypothetical protein T492DRAFT_844158 [Pavlovales sp. CCMP2436]|nr:hypothetical protein T492DRAFT_844158 [Pavlovales sp. CCMP2436]
MSVVSVDAGRDGSGGQHPSAQALAQLLPEASAQRALLGALAVLIGRGLRTWGDRSAPFAYAFLARLARELKCATAGEAKLTSRALDELAALNDSLVALVDSARARELEPSHFVAEIPEPSRSLVLSALVAYCALPHRKADGGPALEGGYDARSRQLLKGMCLALALPVGVLVSTEDLLAAQIAEMAALREVSAQTPRSKGPRSWMAIASIAGAAAVGGVLVAVTAGVAAPAVGAGLMALSGVSLGGVGGAAVLAPIASFLGTAAGAAAFTSIFGATGAGLAGFKLKRRIGDITDFSFERLDVDAAAAAVRRGELADESGAAHSIELREMPARPRPESSKPAATRLWPRPSPPPADPPPAEPAPAPLPASAPDPARPRLALHLAISGWRRSEAGTTLPNIATLRVLTRNSSPGLNRDVCLPDM